MNSIQKCRQIMLMLHVASSREKITIAGLAASRRSLHAAQGQGGAGTTVVNVHRSSTTNDQKPGVVENGGGGGGAGSVSQQQQQAMFHDAMDGKEWGLPPLVRIQNAVDRFRQEYYIDELPSRTQKSIVEAAEAGKGYVTPEDITRVMANIAEGQDVLTTGEAGDICEAWGEKKIGDEDVAFPCIPADAFLRLLETPSN